ncbi:hypothetical protein BK126_03205 [Paenibacillus sp. FSL H7-0326]|uniref:tyrosine-type recombinase/integrase n=1 Tax=Paenibacillus sp. FSL H7-0326 TaxID=1921144 RepID=UPI00096F4D53|nr:site-specific integrase [Paenibacillus sp. FSL H7-0326]OMC71136.1 hypothetical protein BK126_03205 [Paenibacillus sp. FSL H7-0326]
MGWVEKRNNGYRMVVDVPDMFGKRKRKTKMVYTNSKRQAEKELIIFEAEQMKTVVNHKNIKFKDFIEQWKELYVNKHLEETTKMNYISHIDKRITPVFGEMYLRDITTLQLVTFIDGLKKIKKPQEDAGQATKLYVYRVLRSMFNTASEWYDLDPNPMKKVNKPKENENKNVNTYTEEESIKILKALQHENIQFKTMITLAFTSGMRKGELLGLEWKRVDLTNNLIHIEQSIPIVRKGEAVIKSPKTKGSVRTIAIPQYVTEELKLYKEFYYKEKAESEEWYSERDFLFCNLRYKGFIGKPMYPKVISERWKNFISKVEGVRRIRFHDIRHTSVSILINRGIHAKVISNLVGHSKIGTTMDVYGHLMRTAEIKAAETFGDVFNTPTS